MHSRAPTGQEVEVGIRPEDLRFSSGGEGELAFAKDFVEELGATRLIHGGVGEAPVAVAVATAASDEGSASPPIARPCTCSTRHRATACAGRAQ